jgi:uncharacterized protein YkwD
VLRRDDRTVLVVYTRSAIPRTMLFALCVSFLLSPSAPRPSTNPAPARAETLAPRFRTCAALLKRYPHGVARSETQARALNIPARPVLYRRNAHLDTDADGVLCTTSTPAAVHSTASTIPVQPPTPAPTPVAETSVSTAELIALVNNTRQSAGIAPVLECSVLDASAAAHALDMTTRRYFSHQSPEGAYPWDRALGAGYGSGVIGENITLGPRNATEAVGEWVGSDSHRRNLLNPKWVHVGHGISTTISYGVSRSVWVQVFGVGGSC